MKCRMFECNGNVTDPYCDMCHSCLVNFVNICNEEIVKEVSTKTYRKQVKNPRWEKGDSKEWIYWDFPFIQIDENRHKFWTTYANSGKEGEAKLIKSRLRGNWASRLDNQIKAKNDRRT